MREKVEALHLLQDVLLPHEIEWLEKQQHRPNAATQVGRMSLKHLPFGGQAARPDRSVGLALTRLPPDASAMPDALLQVLTEAVRALRVPDYQRVMIDTEISNFHVNLAACERLFSQPIPVAYTRHTSRYHMACSMPSLLLTFLLIGVLDPLRDSAAFADAELQPLRECKRAASVRSALDKYI